MRRESRKKTRARRMRATRQCCRWTRWLSSALGYRGQTTSGNARNRSRRTVTRWGGTRGWPWVQRWRGFQGHERTRGSAADGVSPRPCVSSVPDGSPVWRTLARIRRRHPPRNCPPLQSLSDLKGHSSFRPVENPEWCNVACGGRDQFHAKHEAARRSRRAQPQRASS